MSRPFFVAADDLSVLWAPYEERLKTAESPRRRQVLETLIEHLRTEASGDLEGVMATVAPDAEFSTPYGPGPKGWDEVREHYAQMFAAGGLGNMAVDTHRIVVDDDAIVNEYTISVVLPWNLAKEQGYAIEEEGHYAIHQRACTMLPFDSEGRLRGEITYAVEKDPNNFDRLADDQLSPGYLDWLDALPKSSS